MDCALCKQPIPRHNPTFNHLKIAEGIEVDLCQRCIDSFLKWQQGTLAKLFPTTAMKRYFKK